jgi:hypothetical protein
MKAILIVLFITASVYAGEFQERVDIDPVAQGVWHALAVSEDGGNVVTPCDYSVARATAGSVVLDGGKRLLVSSVKIAKDSGGRNGNIIFFSNDTVAYYIGDTATKGLFILQVFWSRDDGTLYEKIRYVIRVE